ncbi:MAG: hypothetical protein HRF46_02055 [Acidobacteriota bacterium]|jgi:photosystem II stability/assembly factor-like uncharacterized protein
MALIVLMALAAPTMAQRQAETPRWRPLGPWGGRATAFFADPQVDRIWALTTYGQLHRSDDGGHSWTWLGRGVPEEMITVLAPSPHTQDLVLAAANHAGVWRSRDAGRSWEEARYGLPVGGSPAYNAITALAWDPTRPQVAYALTASGSLYVTRDDGTTWRPQTWPSLPPGALGVLMAITEDGNLLLALQGSVYFCSPTLGDCAKVLGGLSGQPSALAALPGQAGAWLADGSDIWRSLDGGISWEAASAGLSDVPSPSGPLDIRQFRMDSTTGVVYALANAGLLRWHAPHQRWELAAKFVAAFSPPSSPCGWLPREGGHLVGCSGPHSPRFCREGEEECEARHHGFSGRLTVAVLLDPRSGTPALAADSWHLYRWHEASASWLAVLDFSHSREVSLLARPNDPSHMLAITESGVFASHDEGWTWSNLPLPVALSSCPWPRPAVFAAPRWDTILVACGSSLWRSVDLGSTWEERRVEIQAMAVHPSNPDHILGTRFYRPIRSFDSGRTWYGGVQAQELVGRTQCPVFPCGWDQNLAVEMDPFRPERYLIGTDGVGMRVCESDSCQWVSSPFTNVIGLAADPHVSGRVVAAGVSPLPRSAGAFGAVRESPDWGESWYALGHGGDGLPWLYGWSVSLPHGRYAVASHEGIFLLEATPRDNRPLRRSGPARR